MNRIIGMQGENLVFLMSMPRSGSTLLSMILSTHTKISCPPEPWLLLFVAEYFNLANVRAAPYGRNNAQIAALDFLLGLEYEKSGTMEDIINGNPSGFNEERNIGFVASEFVRNAYSAQLTHSGKSIFIDKTPRYYTIIPLIDKYFPLAKKIFIKRNPLDIALSYLTTWKIPINELVGDVLSVNSRDFTEGLFTFTNYFSSPNPHKYIVAYEDIVSDAPLQMAKICEFIGVGYQPSMLKFYENDTVIQKFRNSAFGDPNSLKNPKAISSGSVGRGITKLKQSELQSLLNFLGGKVFRDLGYGDELIVLNNMGIDIPDEQITTLLRRNTFEKLHSKTIVENDRKNLLGLHIETITETLKRAESDREALTEMLKESEADRAARWEQIVTLTEMIKALETDNAERWVQIETLSLTLKEWEENRFTRGGLIGGGMGFLKLIGNRFVMRNQITALTAMLNETKAEQLARSQQIVTLTRMLKESEVDRAARWKQIEILTAKLNESEADQLARNQQIETLTGMLNESEADRIARWKQIETLTVKVNETEADQLARNQQIEILTGMLNESEADRLARWGQIEALTAMLKESETDRLARSRQIETLTGLLKQLEVDRAAGSKAIDIANEGTQ